LAVSSSTWYQHRLGHSGFFGFLVSRNTPYPRNLYATLTHTPARWITPIFVGFDIVALLAQVTGAVILATTEPDEPNGPATLNKGKTIAMVGVVLQLVAFGLFTVVAVRFHFTSKRFADDFKQRLQAVPGGKYVSVEGHAQKFNPNWWRLLYAVNISCAMILVSHLYHVRKAASLGLMQTSQVRSIYREIDFAEGKTGYTQRYEYL
jgi:hypothetical protein